MSKSPPRGLPFLAVNLPPWRGWSRYPWIIILAGSHCLLYITCRVKTRQVRGHVPARNMTQCPLASLR